MSEIKNMPLGLTGVLPVDKVDGKNVWPIKGWDIEVQPNGERRFSLILVDGRRTQRMGSSALLKHLAGWESAHQDLLFKRLDGGFDYKQTVTLSFEYNSKARQFTSKYWNINITTDQPKVTPPKNGGIEAYV